MGNPEFTASRARSRWPLVLPLLPMAVLPACDGAEPPAPAPAAAPALSHAKKDGPRPAEMTLKTAALATVFTDAGTRIDFVEPAPGGGVFVTESGPATAQEVFKPLAKKHVNDPLAAFRALKPDGLVPQALIDAHERARHRAGESRLRLQDDQGSDLSPSGAKGSVGSYSAALTQGTYTGSGCTEATVDEDCNYGPDWFLCHKNAWSDYWIQRVDNDGVFETVCVFTSQYVQWKVQVRPWWSWETFGDFTVGGGTFRSLYRLDYLTDFDYHSNVYNVWPDGYHRGASGDR